MTAPNKAEYKVILYRVLNPLHKANSRKWHKFHKMLLASCIQSIHKDLVMGVDILEGLLCFWSKLSAHLAEALSVFEMLCHSE